MSLRLSANFIRQTTAVCLIFFVLTPKIPIAKIAESGHDVAVFVELFVVDGDDDVDAWEMFLQICETFGCGNDADEYDVFFTRASFDELPYRHDSRTTRRKHRVQDNDSIVI